jgi:hypothetical protein
VLESAERRPLIVQHSVDRDAAGEDPRRDPARAECPYRSRKRGGRTPYRWQF